MESLKDAIEITEQEIDGKKTIVARLVYTCGFEKPDDEREYFTVLEMAQNAIVESVKRDAKLYLGMEES